MRSRELAAPGPVARVLLAGKHELAAELYAALSADEGVELGAVTCSSEDVAGVRPGLKAALALRGHTALGDPAHSGPAALLAAVRSFRPQVLISAGYDRLIRPAVIEAVPWCLNLHFGALPRYRGSFSIPWAILNQEPSIGVTLHEVDVGLDSGPIVAQSLVPNDPALGARDLYLQAVERGLALARTWLGAYRAGEAARGIPQDEETATYYPLTFPGGFQIEWRQLARAVQNYVRASHFPPLPGAWSCCEGARLEFPHPVEVAHHLPRAAPGTIVEYARSWGVSVLNGTVIPERVLVDGREVPLACWAGKRLCQVREFATASQPTVATTEAHPA